MANSTTDNLLSLETSLVKQLSIDGNSSNNGLQNENQKTEIQQNCEGMTFTKPHYSLSEKASDFKAKRWLGINISRFRSNPALLRHLEVERFIKIHEERRSREKSVLLLGSGRSGKMTLLKSMRFLWTDGIGHLELEEWKRIIKSNLCIAVNNIMDKMESENLPYESLEKHERVHLMDMIASDNPFDSYPELVHALNKFWKDAAIQEIFKRSIDLQEEMLIMGNEAYFFDSLHRIAHKNYTPSNSDILWARKTTPGITEATFDLGQKIYRVLYLGNVRGERKKWIHVFEDIRVVVCAFDIAEFNESPLENTDINHMQESLSLFEGLSNSNWFKKSAIILLFTKLDKLGSKLKLSPLENLYPDYSGGSDIEAAKTYITEKFVALAPKHHRPLCVSTSSIVGDEKSLARVVGNGIDYLTRDSDKIHKGHENASYFVMGEDGIARYH